MLKIKCPYCRKILKQLSDEDIENLIWSIETEKNTTIEVHLSECPKAPISAKQCMSHSDSL